MSETKRHSTQVDARPGIVPGRPDPYVYAGHFSSLNMARLADGMVRETASYAIKHDDLWALQQAAESAIRVLWTAISQHSIHCHGCDRHTSGKDCGPGQHDPHVASDGSACPGTGGLGKGSLEATDG